MIARSLSANQAKSAASPSAKLSEGSAGSLVSCTTSGRKATTISTTGTEAKPMARASAGRSTATSKARTSTPSATSTHASHIA